MEPKDNAFWRWLNIPIIIWEYDDRCPGDNWPHAKFRPVVKWSGPRSLRRSSLPFFWSIQRITNLPNLPPSPVRAWVLGFPNPWRCPQVLIWGPRVKKNLAGCSDSRRTSCVLRVFWAAIYTCGDQVWFWMPWIPLVGCQIGALTQRIHGTVPMHFPTNYHPTSTYMG